MSNLDTLDKLRRATRQEQPALTRQALERFIGCLELIELERAYYGASDLGEALERCADTYARMPDITIILREPT